VSSVQAQPDFRVDGQHALVTGASRGLGFAAAAALAKAGARVTLVARAEDQLRQACEQITSAGGQCDGLKLDVTSPIRRRSTKPCSSASHTRSSSITLG